MDEIPDFVSRFIASVTQGAKEGAVRGALSNDANKRLELRLALRTVALALDEQFYVDEVMMALEHMMGVMKRKKKRARSSR